MQLSAIMNETKVNDPRLIQNLAYNVSRFQKGGCEVSSGDGRETGGQSIPMSDEIIRGDAK